MNIAHHPYNILRQRFGATLTDVGFDLMNRFLFSFLKLFNLFFQVKTLLDFILLHGCIQFKVCI